MVFSISDACAGSSKLLVLLSVLPLAVLPLATATPACANGPHSLLIMDANSGNVLLNQDGDEPRHPASLTKMMTLYLAFDALEHGRLTMATRIKISAHAANAAPSKLEIPVGEDIAVEDAIKALITKSANDIAIALAEQLGGTEPDFAGLMTAKAHDLGMKATTFKNASGLPDTAQITTARDMVTLGLRLHDDFPKYFPLFATRAYTYNGATFRNHNTLMLQMPGINGIKTGYTHASGYNLVSSLESDGRHLVGAIFGGETASLRNITMRVALSKSLSRASAIKTRKPALVAARAAPKPAPAVRKPRVETPQVAANFAAPAPAPVATAAAAPPPPTENASMPASPAPLKIDVAKVRPVSITMAKPAPDEARQPPEPAPQVAAAGAPPPAAAEPVQPQTAAMQPQTAVAPAPVATAEPPRAPSRFEQHMASLAQNIVPDETPAPAAPAMAAPARPPSTLNAQLAQLLGAPQPGAVSAPTYRLKGPAPDAALPSDTTSPTLGYEIQIGAYTTPIEAEKRLTQAAAQVPGPLAGHTPTRQTASVNDKTYYRARFTGYDAASAASACAELNKHAINCLALKAE